jgi:glucoamylase
VLAAAIAAGVLSAAPVALGAPAHTRAAATTATVATGAPGDESFFDEARKDCVGTARNTTSKVWYTVADGMLSDTYWPTEDATNVHSLQYVVSNGTSFTDIQARNMKYKVVNDTVTGMSCTIVASSAKHHYSIRTTYIADPARDAVDMQVTFTGPAADHLYVRLDPLAGGTGGGHSTLSSTADADQNAGGNSAVLTSASDTTGPVPVAFNTNTHTNAANRDYAVPTFEALEASSGFSDASVGYAGSDSDGLTTLVQNRSLTPSFSSAPDGHVALTAELPNTGRPIDLALGFGTTQPAALSTAHAGATASFPTSLLRYQSGWEAYDSALTAPSKSLGAAARSEYYESVNVVKASEDKTFPGAVGAGLASPWGQSVPAGIGTDGVPTYFGSYREVFARDDYEAFSGLLSAGDVTTAQDITKFLFDRQQQADGSMPRNSLLNGEVAPDTGGLQLDETAYPILMDWQSGLAGDAALYTQHVIPAADFLVAHGPFSEERWEEQSGFSPSTIAAEIAGLTAAANIANAHNDPMRANVYQATADDFARNIKSWTVTDNGPYVSGSIPSYFVRITKAGDPDSGDTLNLGNGSLTSVDQRAVIDQGFLELVRLGVLPATDPVVQDSLKVVDATIERNTPSGEGFYRYGTSDPGSEDGYGDCFVPDPTSCTLTGAPWPSNGNNVGSGHLWPVLSDERAEYDLADGNAGAAQTLLTSMGNMTSGQGLEPEQVWEDPAVAASPFGTDPETASIGFTDGEPDGSASPLTWAQSTYARLTADVTAGHDVETPDITTARYVTDGMPGTLPLTITSPTPGTSVAASTIDVTGTTAPGATVDAEAVGTQGGTAGIASAQADPTTGAFTVQVPAAFGTTTITVTATQGDATGYAQTSASSDVLPGTTVLDVPDPVGDDNGPGTYAYPTSGDFHPGAFDLTRMQVSQDDSNVYVQVSLANLDPTFGTNFGAQLLDLYVRAPGTGPFSTAAAFPSRNYTLASDSAWSERVEAQGFAAPVWQDASGDSLGNPQFLVDNPAKRATLVLPKAAFGTVTPGWTFTVTLTGQDGFSGDQARSFAPTPQPFQFGVCGPGISSPICAVDPNTVPKVMDTITPPSASQDTELDPTVAVHDLHGVVVP